MSVQTDNGNPSQSADSSVAIIGAGSIGAAFALMFAAGGCTVRLTDSSSQQRSSVCKRIAESLQDLESFGLLGQGAEQVLSRIKVVSEIGEAVQGVDYVQECAPEDLGLKQALFAELDVLARGDTILASSSSALTVSEIAGSLDGAGRCIVAHPGNPPFLLRVVELVPAPFTFGDVLSRARELLRSIGLQAVTVRKEPQGFVFNRLQGAVLREAYSLVKDGVASVEDIDLLVRDGLGLRWAVVGPFETADLNRRGGIGKHAQIMGPAYAAMGAERGQHDTWSPQLVAQVEAERRALLPLEEWEERVRWRDRQLMAVLAARLNNAE
jgi:L-gulonate 3-dehydrogenase